MVGPSNSSPHTSQHCLWVSAYGGMNTSCFWTQKVVQPLPAPVPKLPPSRSRATRPGVALDGVACVRWVLASPIRLNPHRSPASKDAECTLLTQPNWARLPAQPTGHRLPLHFWAGYRSSSGPPRWRARSPHRTGRETTAPSPGPFEPEHPAGRTQTRASTLWPPSAPPADSSPIGHLSGVGEAPLLRPALPHQAAPDPPSTVGWSLQWTSAQGPRVRTPLPSAWTLEFASCLCWCSALQDDAKHETTGKDLVKRITFQLHSFYSQILEDAFI